MDNINCTHRWTIAQLILFKIEVQDLQTVIPLICDPHVLVNLIEYIDQMISEQRSCVVCHN